MQLLLLCLVSSCGTVGWVFCWLDVNTQSTHMGRIYCDRTQSSVAMLTMLTSISGVTFFFLATILVTSKCSSVSDVEWNSLRDLYESTDGQNWDWRNENLFGPKWDFTYLTDPCNKNGTAWQVHYYLMFIIT